jgi:putative Mg2+ transporter-C (MgtC) family protein
VFFRNGRASNVGGRRSWETSTGAMIVTAYPTAAALVAISSWDVLLRLCAASGLGASIGFEREVHAREAGTRTHMLVALGSCLFTLVGAYGFHDLLTHGASFDPTRIAAQVVTGIGFLGGGAILRQGLSVRGLTTAGSLWMSAAVGLACGAQAYWAAVFATALTLFALSPLRFVARRLTRDLHGGAARVTIEVAKGQDVKALLDELGQLRGVEITDATDRRLVVADIARGADTSLLARLADLDYVLAVRSE